MGFSNTIQVLSKNFEKAINCNQKKSKSSLKSNISVQVFLRLREKRSEFSTSILLINLNFRQKEAKSQCTLPFYRSSLLSFFFAIEIDPWFSNFPSRHAFLEIKDPRCFSAVARFLLFCIPFREFAKFCCINS